MSTTFVLIVFMSLRIAQHLVERWLSRLNRQYYLDPKEQNRAVELLKISPTDMSKTLAYSQDKYRFATVTSWISTFIFLGFIALGGFGWFESVAKQIVSFWNGGAIWQGLIFFGLLGIASMFFNLPFELYMTFRIEEKHGFNRQTVKGFFGDRLKGLVIAMILGGVLLSLLLYIMESSGQLWWLYAWLAMSGFSIFTAWLYPALLAPLFNKFKPLENGELKDLIYKLAEKIGFSTDGLFVMDASKRSSHGNAYFTGLFGKKRIVLFDTLVDSMSANQVVAVLAHELGHFKLHHIRWQLIRGVLMTGVIFYLLSLCLPLEVFYRAFGFEGISYYAALLVFGLWFGVVDFLLQPFASFMSRRNEFAADAFAKKTMNGDSTDLAEALLKLREKSHVMPISHPLFSMFYHSHPPLIERLKALKA